MGLSEETGTIVLGAGAAGLAAAAELVACGHHVTVLEARDRAGGRILTKRDASTAVPIELGAEFIHGESAAVMRWLKTANDAAIDVARGRWVAHGGKLRRADANLAAMKEAFGRFSSPKRDMTFAEFLERHRRSVRPAIRQFACNLVEGFDAADVTRISAKEVLDEWSGPASADGPTFRPARGYDTMIQVMRNTLRPDRAQLHFDTIVRTVTWRRGRVTVVAERRGEFIHVEAARAIVTVPLGVLQLPQTAPNSVRFTPELPGKRSALKHLAAGPVIKVVMRFKRPFWAEIHGARYRGAAFFFAPSAAFPTFWTSLPARTSIMVAWCGGSRADRLAGKTDSEMTSIAFDSLRAVFGRRNYSSLLESAYWHDWQRDPFSCGAYSYVLAHGARARRSLAAPIDDTLFFAGEACDTRGEAATVGGALQSGARAARQVLAAASRAHRSAKRSID